MVRSVSRSSRRTSRSAGVNTATGREPSGSATSGAAAAPAEREVRREDRLTERTIAGEKLDFTGHIDPRLVVEQSPIVPAGVAFPLNGWITVGRASSSDIVLDEHFVSSTHARFVPRGSFYYV